MLFAIFQISLKHSRIFHHHMKGQALKKVEYSLPLLLASMQHFHLLDCDSVVDCLMLNFVTNLDLTPHLLPNLEINLSHN